MIERIAVLGAGEVGAGWAALAAAHGREVAVHDPDARALERAGADVAARVARLVSGGLAGAEAASRGLARLRLQHAVADAVAGAGLIIEAAPESLATKQAVLAAAEAAAFGATGGVLPHPILASSSSGLHASALGTPLRQPGQLLVVHPLVPVELIPVVEVIPGPATDAGVTAAVRAELEALGRRAVTLRREVPGNVVGRIAAAVWRESIDLVLEGVLDAAELDRLIADGPCLGWAAGGPHLTYELADDEGLSGFLRHLGPTFEEWWSALSRRTTLDPAERARLGALVGAAYREDRAARRDARDRRLLAIARALRSGGGLREPDA